MPGSQGPQGSDSGASGSQPPGWEDASSSGAGDGDWESSNQLPGNSDIPPMPSSQGTPQAGDGSGGGQDGELDAALEDFDGEILAERQVIRARSNEGAGADGSSSIPMPSSGSKGAGDSPMGQSGPAGAKDGSDTPGGPMGVPRSRSAPPAPVAGAGKVPDDVPDAADDDIIARQLREAAMQETDPELKEKLWDEYRRYKGA